MNVSKAGGMGGTDNPNKAIRRSAKKVHEGSVRVEGGISKSVTEIGE